jgi:hypothetical protein
LKIYSLESSYGSEAGCWKTNLAFFLKEEDALEIQLKIEEFETRYAKAESYKDKSYVQVELDTYLTDLDIHEAHYLGRDELYIMSYKIR